MPTGVIVSGGTPYYIVSGQTDTSDVVLNGGVLTVDSGGIAIGTVVSSGGYEVVLSGGVASGTVVLSFGIDQVSGVASGTIVSGGIEDVFSGGAATGTVVSSGGYEVVASGGVASGTVVLSGGIEESDGGAIGTVVSSGGAEYVFSGSVASDTVVSSGGFEFLNSGGVASGSVISSGGIVGLPLTSAYGQWSPISSTIVLDGVTIQSGAIVDFSIYQGGSISDFVVTSGGEEFIESGGVASGTLMSAGGMIVSAGGTAISTLVIGSSVLATKGGTLTLLGGTASGTVLSNGGFEAVSSGGIDYGATIGDSVPGGMIVFSGGKVISATVIGSGNFDPNGGYLQIRGGTASGSVISNGGNETVSFDGTATGATVRSGGVEQVSAGGMVISATVIGGLLRVRGGTTSETTVSSGGREVVSSGGVDFGATILTGGEMIVSSGGLVTSATVIGNSAFDPNGGLLVISGGTVSNTTVSSGGTLVVLSGGLADPTTIFAGGREVVSAGGTDNGAIVAGGEQDVFGSASGTTVSSGGLQIVESGGTAVGTTIKSGGTEYVNSGGTAQGVTFGGTSATLDLESPQGLSGTISNWQVGDTIDFVNTSVTSAGISGSTLTITISGGQSYAYQLSGQQSNDADLQSDGSGGTDVVLDIEQKPTLSVALSGNAVEGATLTVTPTLGTDGDNSVADVTYQWQRNGSAISGATGSTYVVGEADEGAQITVVASFTDDTGQSVSSTSAATAKVTEAPATLSVTVSGAAQEGQTLTAVPLASSGDAVVTYQWQSSVNGTSWINIGGAKSATYTVKEADETHFLRVVAKSTDTDGPTASATSAPTLAVIDAAPTITTPTITGTVQEGKVLTAHASAGQGDNAMTYQWFSSADGYLTAIGSGANYTLKEGDETQQIEVVATATNGNGVTTSKTSGPTAAVLDVGPTVSTPIITGTAQDGMPLTASAVAGEDELPTYRWFSSADGYTTAIAAGSTYTIQDSNEGFSIKVVATVQNETGAIISKTSAATAIVSEPAPALTIASTSLTLPKGGTVGLGISVQASDSDDTAQVAIRGIASYEYVTNGLDANKSVGSSVIFSAAEVSSGLTLHSTYAGSAQPVNTLSVFAFNTTSGETSRSATQRITVTDPPASLDAKVALLVQYAASSFATFGDGHGATLGTDSAIPQLFLAQPHG